MPLHYRVSLKDIFHGVYLSKLRKQLVLKEGIFHGVYLPKLRKQLKQAVFENKLFFLAKKVNGP